MSIECGLPKSSVIDQIQIIIVYRQLIRGPVYFWEEVESSHHRELSDSQNYEIRN